MRLGQHLFGYASDAFWVDVGELKGYLTGVNWVLRNIVKNPPRDARVIGPPNEAVFARGDITVVRNAKITGAAWGENGTTLGGGVQVKPGNVLKKNSQLLSGTRVAAGVVLGRDVIG